MLIPQNYSILGSTRVTVQIKANQPGPPKAQEQSVTGRTKPHTPAIKATVATRSGLPILTLKGKR